METQSQAPAGIVAVERLEGAINSHDIDQLVACFAPDFVSRQPAHPSRDFTGREQVRQNWAMIFAGVPDLRAKLVRSTLSGDTAWAEWEWSGTRRDGQPHEMRGVTVQGISGDQLAWVNFYMEMVDVAGADVMTSIREMTK